MDFKFIISLHEENSSGKTEKLLFLSSSLYSEHMISFSFLKSHNSNNNLGYVILLFFSQKEETRRSEVGRGGWPKVSTVYYSNRSKVVAS